MWVSVHSYCLDLICVHQNGSAFPLGSLLGYDIMLWPQPGSDETGAVAPPEGSRTFNGGNTLAKGTVDGRNIRSVGKTLGSHPAPLPPRCNVLWCSSFGRMLRIVSSVRRPSAPTLKIASGGRGSSFVSPALRIFLPSTVSFPRFSTWVEPLVLWYFVVVRFFCELLKQTMPLTSNLPNSRRNSWRTNHKTRQYWGLVGGFLEKL